jgi:hypothetical protein
MIEITFLFVAKSFTVADEKLKIARIRLVHVRIINLVHDAVAQGKPKPATRMIRGAETFLGAGGPAGLNARSAKGDGVSRGIHFLKS